MSEFAMLDGRLVVKCDMTAWGEWLENNRDKKRVAWTEIKHDGKTIHISTVFLGLNHSWDQVPLWFETLVFDGPNDGDMERYTTYKQAEHGHEEMVKRVKELLAGPETTRNAGED